MSGGAEDGMAREYDPAVYRKGLAEIKENMSLDAFVAWGEGMIAAIEVLAKRLEAAEHKAEGWVQHDTEAYAAQSMRALKRADGAEARAVAAAEERDAARKDYGHYLNAYTDASEFLEAAEARLEAATDALREIVALHDEGHAECFSSAASDYAEIARAVVGA